MHAVLPMFKHIKTYVQNHLLLHILHFPILVKLNPLCMNDIISSLYIDRYIYKNIYQTCVHTDDVYFKYVPPKAFLFNYVKFGSMA